MPIPSTFRCGLAATLFLLAVNPVKADSSAVPYGIVRGWTVTVNLLDGYFDTCEAMSGDRTSDDWISVEAGVNGWLINTPWPYAEAGLIGGSLGIDGRRIDAAWSRDPEAFEATASLPAGWIDAVAQGSRLEFQIGDEPLYDHPLSGSAAAIGKLRECVALRGELPDPGTVLSEADLNPAPIESDVARLGAGCPAWGEMRSPRGGGASTLEFINGSDAALMIAWLGFDGSVSEYAALMPGERVTMETSAGHLWIAKDAEGSCHGGVITAPNGAGTVMLP